MANKCALATCLIALAIAAVVAKEESCAVTGDCVPSEEFDTIPSEAGLSLLQRNAVKHAINGEEAEVEEDTKEDAAEREEPEVEEDMKEDAVEGQEAEMEEDMKEDAVEGDVAEKTEYSDLGSGKCLYQPPTPKCPPPPPAPPCHPKKPKAVNPKYSYKSGQGKNCRALCDKSKDCGGYSVSDYDNCLLWNDSDLIGGGRPWGACDCYVKDKAGYKNLGSGKCLYQPPTPKCPPPPPAPPCHPKKPKAVNPKYSYKSGQGKDCRALCDKSKDCGGYSVSDYDNCLLWNDSDLIGGGKPWGACKCYAKK